MVGAAGFEPATSWSQTRRTSQAMQCPVAKNDVKLNYKKYLDLDKDNKTILLIQEL